MLSVSEVCTDHFTLSDDKGYGHVSNLLFQSLDTAVSYSATDAQEAWRYTKRRHYAAEGASLGRA